MKLEDGVRLANVLKEFLASACERIEVVGSNKRQDKPDVHDVELLLIPLPGHPVPKFGSKKNVYTSFVEERLAGLIDANVLRYTSKKVNGPKYKKFAVVEYSNVNDFCLDVFIVSRRTWGIQNVIRTGPSLFSHRFVANQSDQIYDKETMRKWSGLLPDKYRYVAGETQIMENGQILPIPEEQDAIELLGHGWIPPSERRVWAYK